MLINISSSATIINLREKKTQQLLKFQVFPLKQVDCFISQNQKPSFFSLPDLAHDEAFRQYYSIKILFLPHNKNQYDTGVAHPTERPQNEPIGAPAAHATRATIISLFWS